MEKDKDPFKTPEEIERTKQSILDTKIVDHIDMSKSSDSTKSEKLKKKRSFLKFSKKKIIILVTVVVIIFVGTLIFYLNKTNKVVDSNIFHPSQKNSSIKPKSNLVPSNLTGLMVNPSINNLPVTAVMVENSLQARPQSGLEQAGVIFEAMAEGGITRYMALYQDTAPNYVGPIRSARPYFVSWAMGFDAAYAHVGGSPQALQDIQSWGTKDLNQFYYGNYYTRISTRVAPHNVYTSLAELHSLESTLGYKKSIFTSWPRANGTPLKNPTATSINLTLSNSYFNPSYNYDQTTNSYNRDLAGQPEVGTDTNLQYSPKVVIAIVVPETNGPLDASGAYYSDYSYIGSGQAYIFQNGGVQIGQWSKSSNNSQIMFTNNSGQNITLDPGQVWITAVVSSSYVSYT